MRSDNKPNELSYETLIGLGFWPRDNNVSHSMKKRLLNLQDYKKLKAEPGKISQGYHMADLRPSKPKYKLLAASRISE